MNIRPNQGRRNLESSIGQIQLQTFGFSADITPSAPAPTEAGRLKLGVAPRELGDPFQESLQGAGFQHHLDLSVQGVEPSAEQELLAAPRGGFLHVEVPAVPGMALIAVKVEHGVMQFYFPESPAQLKGARAFVAPPPAGRLRFQIPIHPVAPGAGQLHGLMSFSLPGIAGTVIRFLKVKVVERLIQGGVDWAVQYLADLFDNKTEQFLGLDKNYTPIQDADLIPMAGKQSLLFIHGIFSSVEGAFKDLNAPGAGVMPGLAKVYGSRIFGWDHRTVAKTPYDNAADLLDGLPDGMCLDIVCHSRGAAIARALLEHPVLMQQAGTKKLTVGKVIFVAGANQGSPLAARGRWDELINVFTGLCSIMGVASGVSAHVIIGIVKILAHGVLDLPSLRDLTPGSDFYQTLNGGACTPVQEYCYARAHYHDIGPAPLGVLDIAVEGFFGEANDLVVPFAGAGTFDAGVVKALPVKAGQEYGDMQTSQKVVLHTNFFAQPEIRKLLGTELAGQSGDAGHDPVNTLIDRLKIKPSTVRLRRR